MRMLTVLCSHYAQYKRLRLFVYYSLRTDMYQIQQQEEAVDLLFCHDAKDSALPTECGSTDLFRQGPLSLFVTSQLSYKLSYHPTLASTQRAFYTVRTAFHRTGTNSAAYR